MALEVSSDAAICSKCGKKYGRRRGFFPVSYAILHKGLGYIPVCKDCIETMYSTYLSQCHNAKDAVRQMCRKLDLYWNESVYDAAEKKSTTRSIMTQYITKINTATYAGKSYDDTLLDEGIFWNFTLDKTSNDTLQTSDQSAQVRVGENSANNDLENPDVAADNNEAMSEYLRDLSSFTVTKDIITFWGTGYTKQMYAELEQRRAHWMDRLPKDTELDIGTEVLIRQICSLELDINRDRAEGKAVDKSINALNTLLGSANLKPTQKKVDSQDDFVNKPLGVKLYHREKFAPLPELEENEKDRKHIKRYIWTWMGHLCKMCGVKNGYTKLYEEEIERLRVKYPECDDESEEDLIIYDLEDTEDDDADLALHSNHLDGDEGE